MFSVLDPPWGALRRLAPRLEATGVVWRLGGSALQAALGVTDEVGDLDICVPGDALVTVHDALADLGSELKVGTPPDPWCSAGIVRCRLDDVEVEVIGGLCVVADGRRVTIPLDLGGTLDLEGVTVPLADPGLWWWLYRTYRPAAAARLEPLLDPERRAAVEARLGPPGAAVDRP
ncbi:MAG: hypothetical protein JJT89_14245 [Nitriliruptoraceae bacterium]|nr:hypothetical protein [Nitriliruptoraceae bacterium]